jgi:hypothetical protein
MMDTSGKPRTRTTSATWTAALILSAVALLSFLARAFVDFGFVYEELGFDAAAIGFAILVHLALVGGWIWAIVAASHRGRAMYVLLGYAVVLVIWGLFTMRTLCPSPCRTGWPVGETAIWSNVVTGVLAAALAAAALYRRKTAA